MRNPNPPNPVIESHLLSKVSGRACKCWTALIDVGKEPNPISRHPGVDRPPSTVNSPGSP